MLPVTFCGSPGWGSLEPQPTDWPGAGARVWFPDPALALPGWDCPLWPASCISDCYSMLTWPGGPTRQQILPGNTDSAEIRVKGIEWVIYKAGEVLGDESAQYPPNAAWGG